MKGILKNLFNITENNYDVAVLIQFILIVLLIAALIVLYLYLSKQIKDLKNNVKQLINYPVKPTSASYHSYAKEEVVEDVEDIELEEAIEETIPVIDNAVKDEKIKEETNKTENNIVKKQPQRKPKEEKVESKEEIKKENKLKDLLKEEETNETKSTQTTRILLGKYEVFNVNDFHLYRLKASNGEIMVISEVYTTEKGAIAAIDTVKRNIETGTIQIYQDKHGLFQFKLYAKNKRLLAVSANYTTQAKCESAANSFKKFAPISPVVVLEDDPDHLMEEIHPEYSTDKKGGKIAIYGNEKGYEFKLLASNGVSLCTSSEFKTKNAVNNGIVTFKAAVQSGRFFVVKDKNDTYQFKLYAQDKRCIVIGEAYKNKNQAISAAKSLMSFENLAEIVDKTEEEVKIGA